MRAVIPWIERLLWTTTLVCVSYCILFSMEARAYHAQAMELTEPTPTSVMTGTASTGASILGRLEIPEIALSVPILAGDESASLQRGLFHIRGTAMLGGLGTVGLAGHRDTFFRPLRNITTKMGIKLVDASGTYHYVIDSTEIVTPDKVEVLDIRQQPELTLITCYPFDFIGAAPKRFIVHAHLLSASPDIAAPDK
jgi:sortase A